MLEMTMENLRQKRLFRAAYLAGNIGMHKQRSCCPHDIRWMEAVRGKASNKLENQKGDSDNTTLCGG